MSDEVVPKKKTTRNHLTVMQTHDLIEEMKKPGTQQLIDERKFNKVSYAQYLSATLGFKVTRGNLWDAAEQLKLRFHHPMNGVYPGNKKQPTFDDVLMPVGRHDLVEVRNELRDVAAEVDRVRALLAAAHELKDDVKVYGQKVHTTHDTLTGRMLDQERSVSDKLIEILGKVGNLETRVVRQSDRLSEALKQVEALRKFLEGQFSVSIPSG